MTGPYIPLRVYIDEWASNNAIGSSSTKNKICGFYYTGTWDLKIASRVGTVQTLALLDHKDISEFGLSVCLKPTMKELENLVLNGIYDSQSNTTLQVRILACLGDNLSQNQVAGILQNFSIKLEHCCRKCLVSQTDMKNAEDYLDIHAMYHESRTNQMLRENFDEKEAIKRSHVNGVGHRSLFFEFPYFNIPVQLPQCSSHDYLGTNHILRIKHFYYLNK